MYLHDHFCHWKPAPRPVFHEGQLETAASIIDMRTLEVEVLCCSFWYVVHTLEPFAPNDCSAADPLGYASNLCSASSFIM
ncbi:unnamed protein product [Arctia plantaginis]|uniref:Uncharacterized protein n=1 Tax=Arctia plantaginis TaxID=874455 RepID=A0A8S1AZK9_ARCPL|nr:unnamed protein product [Arctia plantaginis]